MISSISGKIIKKTLVFIIVEVSGIGYKIFFNTKTLAKVGKENDKVKLFIHHHVREDNEALYGFITFTELEIFELLISVSGIGPKAALAILSRSDPEQIKAAIIKEDIDIFTAISGVGTKTASKIIIELKGKISSGDLSLISHLAESGDVIEALKSLGYTAGEVKAVLQNLPKNITSTDDKIRWTLLQLGQ